MFSGQIFLISNLTQGKFRLKKHPVKEEHSPLLRGRRKSSQKLAKRRAFVFFWGGRGSRPFSQSRLQKKKIELHVDCVHWALLQIDLSSIERRRAYLAKGCGEQVHRMPCEGRQHMVQRKAGSGRVLRSVDDTCHGSRSTQNRKLAFLVLRTSGTTPSRQPHIGHCCRRSFRPGEVRLVVQRFRCYQQCRAVGDTARFVQ